MPDKRKDQPGNDGDMGGGNRKADTGRPEQGGKEAQRDLDDDRLRREMEESQKIGRSRPGEHDTDVKKH